MDQDKVARIYSELRKESMVGLDPHFHFVKGPHQPLFPTFSSSQHLVYLLC